VQARIAGDAEFVAAALAGAADGLALAGACGVDRAGVRVEITHVQLDYTDLHQSAVRAAAALAVAEAFGLADRVGLAFADGFTVSLRD